MTEREYRQDDQREVGYCPKCGKQLANLTMSLSGYCEDHGRRFADWTPTQILAAEEVARETVDDYTDEDVTRILHEQVRHD